MSTATSTQDRAIDALMQLLAARRWEDIALADIAARAGLSLGELRGAYPSKGAILAGFARRIDQAVLSGAGAGDETEPARERLFDVVMRRFDALEPYREAVRAARAGLLRDPLAMVAWNRVETTSAQWMLAAAGVPEAGLSGALRAQVLAAIFVRLVDVWLDDEVPELPRTMKALDRALKNAERLAASEAALGRLAAPLRALFERRRPRRPEPPLSDDNFMPAD